MQAITDVPYVESDTYEKYCTVRPNGHQIMAEVYGVRSWTVSNRRCQPVRECKTSGQLMLLFIGLHQCELTLRKAGRQLGTEAVKP